MQTIGSKSCILIGCGLKSGVDQRMLTRELQLHKQRFGAKNVILSLVLEKVNLVAPLLRPGPTSRYPKQNRNQAVLRKEKRKKLSMAA